VPRSPPVEWSAGVFKRPRIRLFGCLVARERDQKKTNRDQKKQIRIKKQIGIKKNKFEN
jgi:hypothetical protein